MTNEKNETRSDNAQQPRTQGVERAEPGESVGRGGDLSVDRPRKPGTIEIEGPPGLGVFVSGSERCTKIVIHLGGHEEETWTP